MPKSLNFVVERVSLVENAEGQCIAVLIDGEASEGKRKGAVRVTMDYVSWQKVAKATK